MNIYQRQMNSLGLNVEQYSKMLDIPKSITKKMISGNGEVVKDMEINNFLRKNIFNRHQEIEENKEEKKVEALNIKLKRGENNYDNKKMWLLQEYNDSIEVQWYINEFDRDTYFQKYNVKNKFDLMKRYKFNCNKGRLKGLKEVGESTIDRLICKQYDELGKQTAYALICQLYDCFELGHINAPIQKDKKNNIKKENGSLQKKKYTEENQKLRDWYNEFDFEKFVTENSILYKDIAEAINVPYGSLYPMKRKTYVPNEDVLKKLKDYVDSFENKFETKIIPDEHNAIVSEESIMNSSELENHITLNLDNVKIIGTLTQEDILRNLLKDRLTEQEKIIIKLFGGRI